MSNESNELNAQKVEWDELSATSENENGKDKQNNNQQGNFPKAEFMDLKESGTYKVRLVGSPVRFRRYWKPYKAKTHESLKDLDPAWKAGWYPQKRFAINVIDRADGKLKILEQGITVFEALAVYRKATEIDPGGPDGPDFAITVEIPMKNGKADNLHKKYGVMALQSAPLTTEEKKMLCKKDEEGKVIMGTNGKPVSNLWPITKIFKPTPLEKMQEMWDALSDDQKVAPKKNWDKKDESSTNSPEKTDGETSEEPMETVTTSDEDLFDASDSNEEGGTDLF